MDIKIKGIKKNVGFFGQVIADGEMIIDNKISATFYYTTGKNDVNLTIDSDDLDFYAIDYKAALRAVTAQLDPHKTAVAVPKTDKVGASKAHTSTKDASPVVTTVAKKVEKAVKTESFGTKVALITNKQRLFDYIVKHNTLSHKDAIAYGKSIGSKDPARTLRDLRDAGKISTNITGEWVVC